MSSHVEVYINKLERWQMGEYAVPRFARRVMVMAALACALGAASGCVGPDEPDGPPGPGDDATRFLAMAVSGGVDDVTGIQFDISCDDGTVISEFVPLEDESIPAWLLPQGAGAHHRFADLLTLLAPGVCTVTTTPMQSPGVPSEVCAPATQIVTIDPSVTTEIVLMMQCEGAPNGGLDVVGGLNHPPIITALGVGPSKFVTTCEPALIEVEIEDPNGDDFTTTMTVVTAPTGATYTLTQLPGGGWTFSAQTPGFYEIEIVATDIYGASTTLTFPMHVSLGAPDLCDEQVCCQDPDGVVTTVTGGACVAQMGVVVPDDECGGGGPICCVTNEVFVTLEPGPDCPVDAMPIDDAFCGEVCCDVGGFQSERPGPACSAIGGEIVNTGECVVDVCCQQADGSFEVIPSDTTCGGALVADGFCDTSPTCCLLADLSVVSTTVSDCLVQQGQPRPGECDTCQLDPQGQPVAATCDAAPNPTGADLGALTESLAFRDPDFMRTSITSVEPYASTPVFGRVLDTDADGFITPTDDVFMAVLGTQLVNASNDLNLVDPRTNTLLATYPGVRTYHVPAIADLDADGVVEILTIDALDQLVALHYTGGVFTLAWATPMGALTTNPNDAIAIQPYDLDGDGVLEIVVGQEVFDAAGVPLQALSNQPAYGRASIGDLELDGSAEVVLPDGIYEPFTGQRLVAFPPPPQGAPDLRYQTALVEVDGDPEAEIARHSVQGIEVFDTDGTLIRSKRFNIGDVVGPPCTADFDGDGMAEYAFLTNMPVNAPRPVILVVVDLDTLNQVNNLLPGSNASALFELSCSAGDLDDDGMAEVLTVYDDLLIVENPMIVGGGSSTVHVYPRSFNQAAASPRGRYTVPVITDVDGDGESEVAVAWGPTTDAQATEVALYRSGQGLADLSPEWNAYDAYTGYLTEAGRSTIAHPTPWISGGLTHAKARQRAALDLAVQIDGVCLTSCDPTETVDVAVQVHNLSGSVSTPAGVGSIDVALYADDAGVRTLIGVYPVAVSSPFTGSLPAQTITIPVSALGSDGIVAVVDDDGSGAGVVGECREDNNAMRWDANPCD
jgi:hypothetical protein